MPLNKKVIGKKYQSEGFEVKQHETIYYGLGYNEDNDAYFDNRREGGIIAPPMYAVAYGSGPTANIILDEEIGLNFMMVVHYTHEYHWIKPVKPGDVISNEATITNIDERENGSVLSWETVSKNQNGEVVAIGKWGFFDRSAKVEGAGKPPKPAETEKKILWTQEMKVRNGQTYIYAEPSMNHNIIHIDNDVATQLGLPGIILQGLCTMAFAHKCAVDNMGGKERDPLKITKLGVQMARPVLPGETLTYQGYKIGEEEGGGIRYGIIAKNQDGKEVLKDAFCVVE